MSCCVVSPLSRGRPPGSGTTDASALVLDFTTTNAVPVAFGLVSLPNNGAHALIRSFAADLVNETAGAEGQGFGGWYFSVGTALRNGPDGSVHVRGPNSDAFVAPSVLWATGIPAGGGGAMLGYGPGPVFGAPLAAFAMAIAANVLTITATGIAATTLRWHVRASIWAFDGAIKLL